MLDGWRNITLRSDEYELCDCVSLIWVIEEIDELVGSLNLLLDTLDIPIELESPYDLTPSLLLAILESTLKSRLPLSDKLRQAHSRQSSLLNKHFLTGSLAQSKVEAVKVFLGVLGNDVLKLDLSDVDPRRLARGEWKEVVYTGILLVRVAKQARMLEPDAFDIIDLDPDATASQIGSEVTRELSHTPHSSSPPPAGRSRPVRAISPPVPITPTRNVRNNVERKTPRPPERESTPPSTTRKTSYMTYRPIASPPKLALNAPSEVSICSCSFREDLTGSTIHCHCEIHGSGDEHFEESLDVSQSEWRNTDQLPRDILSVSVSFYECCSFD